MNARAPISQAVVGLGLRWLLGGFLVYVGMTKALQPVEFLKLTREYGVVEGALGLNVIAATLPWFEVVCGLLLMAGVAVRGTALTVLLMLATFTVMVVRRAWEVQASTGLAFCEVRFDCGCGTGEVLICYKLVENALLALACALLLVRRFPAWTIRHNLVGAETSR